MPNPARMETELGEVRRFNVRSMRTPVGGSLYGLEDTKEARELCRFFFHGS